MVKYHMPLKERIPRTDVCLFKYKIKEKSESVKK